MTECFQDRYFVTDFFVQKLCQTVHFSTKKVYEGVTTGKEGRGEEYSVMQHRRTNPLNRIRIPLHILFQNCPVHTFLQPVVKF